MGYSEGYGPPGPAEREKMIEAAAEADEELLDKFLEDGEGDLVIDFIHVHYQDAYFPAFNVADSAITVGVTLLFIDMWREERKKSAEDSAKTE